jgi:uncharacterized protein YndB with AHSA1/START domain
MKWLIGALALVVVLVAVVIAIGDLLPKGHVATSTALLPAPPERVWTIITSIEDYPAWRSDVKVVEPLPSADGIRRWRELGKVGRQDRGVTFEAVEAAAPRRLVVRIADQGLPFGGRWEYDLAPAEGGSRLTITERGEVYNPLFRFMSRFVFGHTATIDAYLAALGRRLGGTA